MMPRRSCDPSPVAPRTLFPNCSRPSASASASASPRVEDDRDERPALNELEKQLREHLLKLGKNHVQAAFRYADKNCDNHVSSDDIRLVLETLHVEGEGAKECLKYFSGRGLGIKAFAAWLRGKVSISCLFRDSEQAMRRTGTHRSSSHSAGRSGSAHGYRASDDSSRARSTDGFLFKAAAMPVAECERPAANATDDRLLGYPEPVAMEPGPERATGALEPIVRTINLEHRRSSVSRLPYLDRSRSPANVMAAGGRSQSNASARSSRSGGSRSGGSVPRSRRSRCNSHDLPPDV